MSFSENYIEFEYRKFVDGDNFWVCSGLCNGIQTKWITKTKWDRTTIFVMLDDKTKEIVYKDKNGNQMLVYESDEEEWNCY